MTTITFTAGTNGPITCDPPTSSAGSGTTEEQEATCGGKGLSHLDVVRIENHPVRAEDHGEKDRRAPREAESVTGARRSARLLTPRQSSYDMNCWSGFVLSWCLAGGGRRRDIWAQLLACEDASYLSRKGSRTSCSGASQDYAASHHRRLP
eukprot:scaffold301_cov243-Pinguiococcus_pyrenoidosus.AAC.111